MKPSEAKAVKDVQATIEDWEIKLNRLEDEYEDKFTDNLKVAILISIVPEAIQEKIFEIGTENAWLKNFEDQLPAKAARRLSSEPSAAAGFDLFGNPMDATERRLAEGTTTSAYTGPLDYKGLYGGDARTKFWDYRGSFTTPPCTEAVDFYIMMEPQTMTQAQLDKFKTAIGWGYAPPFGNFRPPQPLNGRVVSGCDEAVWYPYTSNAWAKHVGTGANQLCQDSDMF